MGLFSKRKTSGTERWSLVLNQKVHWAGILSGMAQGPLHRPVSHYPFINLHLKSYSWCTSQLNVEGDNDEATVTLWQGRLR